MPDRGDLDSEGPAQRRVIDVRRVRATVEVARALSLRPSDAVLQVRRVLSLGGVPTILEDLWLPGAAFKGLTAEQIAGYPGPTYAMYEVDFGCTWSGPKSACGRSWQMPRKRSSWRWHPPPLC